MIIKNLLQHIFRKDSPKSRLQELTEYLAERSEVKNIILLGKEAAKIWTESDPKYKFIKILNIEQLTDMDFNWSECILVSKNLIVNESDQSLLKDLSVKVQNLPFFIMAESGISLTKLEDVLKQNNIDNFISGYLGQEHFKSKNEIVLLAGKYANPPVIKKQLKILAMIGLYNEVDIIEKVIQHLVNDNIDVHVVDNWSTDGSFELVQSLAEKYRNLTYERFPDEPQNEYFSKMILGRKQDIAAKLEYDWYIHTDSDEIRVSPWKDKNLNESISIVDSLGFNAIDFTVADFRPIKDGFDGSQNLDNFFRYFEFGTRPGHFIQVKAWKAVKEIDLIEKGGHNAAFEGKKVFPLKFLLKHYPLRSISQGEKKIFKDRLPRVEKQIKATGWHVHYKLQGELKKFIWNKSELQKFGDDFYEEFFLERLTGLGIDRT